MSVLLLDSANRNARKSYRCGVCNLRITRGTTYNAQACVYDDRVYTFRQCSHCVRDGILNLLHRLTFWPDEGVGFEDAVEWAPDAAYWSRDPVERQKARAWLARFCGGEGE